MDWIGLAEGEQYQKKKKELRKLRYVGPHCVGRAYIIISYTAFE